MIRSAIFMRAHCGSQRDARRSHLASRAHHVERLRVGLGERPEVDLGDLVGLLARALHVDGELRHSIEHAVRRARSLRRGSLALAAALASAAVWVMRVLMWPGSSTQT